MTLRKKIAQTDGIILSAEAQPLLQLLSWTPIYFYLFLRNIKTWTIDVGIFIHYYFFF